MIRFSKIEKFMVALIVIIAIIILIMLNITFNRIDKTGGIKQVIIEAGKEVKEIKKEIQKD